MHTIKMIDSDRHEYRVMYAYKTYVGRICEKKCSPTNKQAINLNTGLMNTGTAVSGSVITALMASST